MVNAHQKRKLEQTASLFGNDEYADLEIRCEGRSFKVHKAIICTASSVIASACRHAMQEKNTGVIEHTQYDAKSLERLISYVYTQDYTVDNSSSTEPPNKAPRIDLIDSDDDSMLKPPDPSTVNERLIGHIRVYAIADYYGIDGLKDLATSRVEVICDREELQPRGFLDVVKEVHGSTLNNTGGFSGWLCVMAQISSDTLIKDQAFMEELALADGAQGFAVELLGNLAESLKDVRTELRGTEHDLGKKLGELRQKNNQLVQLTTDRDRLQNIVATKSKAAHKHATEVERLQKQLQVAESDTQHVKDVMGKLVANLKSLPSLCPNSGCRRYLTPLALSRSHHVIKGANEGHWQLRCASCNQYLKG
jgi:hypothetical protein